VVTVDMLGGNACAGTTSACDGWAVGAKQRQGGPEEDTKHAHRVGRPYFFCACQQHFARRILPQMRKENHQHEKLIA
jgi:ribosomal protein L34E